MRRFFFLLVAFLSATALSAETLPVTGPENPALKPFDDLLLSFIQQHNVPGAAVAVTRNGKLVYARGFSYADVEKKESVQPASLFRIASVSKPLTGVAVLQLVERGKLKLDEHIFALLGLNPTGDPRLNDVTILQLLQHTGGWDRGKSFDPMFRSVDFAKALNAPPPASAAQVIENMLKVKLDFTPGERMAYSNFGYCLLGRAIEKVTGQAYDAYVRENVLAPLGIKEIKLGKTLLDGRANGEVRYYPSGGRMGNSVFSPKAGEKVPAAYGAWNIEAMDSHGGWIASAQDLVRFACAFDEPTKCKILNAESIAKMFERPAGLAGTDANGKEKAAYYGCGWMVRPTAPGKANTWHNGRLDGTSTLLVRRSDGLCWAVLFNSEMDAKKGELAGMIDGPMHQAANAVTTWPAIDLFEK